MTNLTLITAGLLGLAFFSTQGLANTPPDEAMPDETVVEQTTDIQGMNEPEVTTETEAAPEPAQNKETIQQGDVLHMEEPAEVVPVRLLDFPRRGMTTDKVENELGRPGEIIPPIGQPPITRWIYDDRTVYFEYSTVLHVVAK